MGLRRRRLRVYWGTRPTDRLAAMRYPDSSDHVRRILDQLWKEARQDYHASGQPFGSSARALDLWIMYGTRTTCN
jgi:hypothetical protein